MTEENELCPCGSGKAYNACCKKEYDAANSARERLKAALTDPTKAKELAELLKSAKEKQ